MSPLNPLSVAPCFAQTEHQRRVFPSDGRLKVGIFSRQPSHTLAKFPSPACAFAQPPHQRFFPSGFIPKRNLFSLQSSHAPLERVPIEGSNRGFQSKPSAVSRATRSASRVARSAVILWLGSPRSSFRLRCRCSLIQVART